MVSLVHYLVDGRTEHSPQKKKGILLNRTTNFLTFLNQRELFSSIFCRRKNNQKGVRSALIVVCWLKVFIFLLCSVSSSYFGGVSERTTIIRRRRCPPARLSNYFIFQSMQDQSHFSEPLRGAAAVGDRSKTDGRKLLNATENTKHQLFFSLIILLRFGLVPRPPRSHRVFACSLATACPSSSIHNTYFSVMFVCMLYAYKSEEFIRANLFIFAQKRGGTKTGTFARQGNGSHP